MKSPAWLRVAQGALDLNRQTLSGSEVQEQINLGSDGCAVEKCIRLHWRGCENILEDEAFPTWSDDRMSEQLFLVRYSEQSVNDAAIAHINLGSAHESLRK